MGMPRWPMQAVRRTGEREWRMYDRECIAIICHVYIGHPGNSWLYRSVTYDPRPERRMLLGYFPSLEMAAHVTWRSWALQHRPIETHYLTESPAETAARNHVSM
ncbi:hypothetical protein ICM05_00945 [Leucobacter sp. cx-42]|uniref:hypothetical protein n=1 Tax=unclassified Leucobacter TaxID=2621730 RepID=UPI00165E4307|nr:MULTISPECIES: hypothetical protein [unclassified Leucobacter]MBC9953214.1 hypothetical protein [Leucobacter sp. cx-42]